MITKCSLCGKSSREVGRLMKVNIKSETLHLCKKCRMDIKFGRRRI